MNELHLGCVEIREKAMFNLSVRLLKNTKMSRESVKRLLADAAAALEEMSDAGRKMEEHYSKNERQPLQDQAKRWKLGFEAFKGKCHQVQHRGKRCSSSLKLKYQSLEERVDTFLQSLDSNLTEAKAVHIQVQTDWIKMRRQIKDCRSEFQSRFFEFTLSNGRVTSKLHLQEILEELFLPLITASGHPCGCFGRIMKQLNRLHLELKTELIVLEADTNELPARASQEARTLFRLIGSSAKQLRNAKRQKWSKHLCKQIQNLLKSLTEMDVENRKRWRKFSLGA